MGYIQDVLAERAALLRGLTLVVGGLALLMAGSMLGLNLDRLWQIMAGVVATTGIVVMLLGVFVYLLPPLLPAK